MKLNPFSPWFKFMDRATRFDNPVLDIFIENQLKPFYRIAGNFDIKVFHTTQGRILLLFYIVINFIFTSFHALLGGVTSLIAYRCSILYSCLIGYAAVNGIWSVTILISQYLKRDIYAKCYIMIWKNFIEYDFEIYSEGRERAGKRNIQFQKNYLFALLIVYTGIISYFLMKPEVNCGDVLQLTFFPAYYPFDLPNEIAITIASCCQIFYVLWAVYLAFFALRLLLNISFHWYMQSKRLIESINNLEQRAFHLLKKKYPGKRVESLDFSIYEDNDFIDCYVFCLKENFKHHQLLIRFQHNFNDSVTIPLGTFLALSSITTAVLMLLLFDSNSGSVVLAISMMLLTLLGLYAISVLGQLFSDFADELRQEVFETNWYTSEKISTLIKVFMEVTKKPLRPRVLGLFHYDMPGFLKVLNAAYSYWNFLRLIQTLSDVSK